VRVLGEPLNSRTHWRFCRKNTVQAVRYLGVLQECKRFLRIRTFMLSKPPLMSRKRVDTMYSAAWSVCMSFSREVTVSAAEILAREMHWFGLMSPEDLSYIANFEVAMRSMIFEMVCRRTIMRNEAGDL
jgi:hypothetical protein